MSIVQLILSNCEQSEQQITRTIVSVDIVCILSTAETRVYLHLKSSLDSDSVRGPTEYCVKRPAVYLFASTHLTIRRLFSDPGLSTCVDSCRMVNYVSTLNEMSFPIALRNLT